MKLWQKIFLILGILLTSFGIYFYSYFEPLFCKISSDTIDKQSLYCLINQARFKHRLQPYKINFKLEEAAELRAYDMLIHNQFGHKSISGRDMGEVIKMVGYQYSEIGENLARGFKNNKEVFETWMSSASHSANILNKSYREFGIAILDNKRLEGEEKITVNLFGVSK